MRARIESVGGWSHKAEQRDQQSRHSAPDTGQKSEPQTPGRSRGSLVAFMERHGIERVPSC